MKGQWKVFLGFGILVAFVINSISSAKNSNFAVGVESLTPGTPIETPMPTETRTPTPLVPTETLTPTASSPPPATLTPFFTSDVKQDGVSSVVPGGNMVRIQLWMLVPLGGPLVFLLLLIYMQKRR